MRRSKVEAEWEETALTTTSSQFTWRLHSPCCATFFMIARDSYFIKSKAAPNVSCRGFMHISWAPGTVSTQGHREGVCVYVVFVSAWGLLHVISVLRRFSVFVVLWFFAHFVGKSQKFNDFLMHYEICMSHSKFTWTSAKRIWYTHMYILNLSFAASGRPPGSFPQQAVQQPRTIAFVLNFDIH